MAVDWPAEMEIVLGEATGCSRAECVARRSENEPLRNQNKQSFYDPPQPCFVECSTSALNALSLDAATRVANSFVCSGVKPVVLSSLALSAMNIRQRSVASVNVLKRYWYSEQSC